MTPDLTKDLAILRTVLEDAGYTVEELEADAVGKVVLAETPYALVACVAADWEGVVERTDAAQAWLTTLAAAHPSARRWDLYVVVAVSSPETPLHDALREAIESDTRYARKLVVAGVRDAAETARGVRALLPLQPPAEIARIDAVEAIRAGLAEQGIADDLVDAAVEEFSRSSEVRIP